MNKIVECDGEVRVPLPPDEALALFTPEGERTWAPGWAPEYPAGQPDAAAPGTVFLTTAEGRTTTWVIVERGERTMRYARVRHGENAGTVSVECRPDARGTRAAVSYRLTPLNAAAAEELQTFAETYPDFMSHWERHIAAALARRA